MKLALAQVSTTVGDLEGNVARLARAAARAALLGADAVLLPELAVTGYPPRDLLLDPAFARAAEDATARLARAVDPALPVIVGTIGRERGALRNLAVVLQGGRVRATRAKALLPCDDVFLEPRWFTPDPGPAAPVELCGRRVGLLVCEDLWDERHPRSPARELLASGATALLCLNASPFRRGILPERLRLARRPGVPLAYVNAVGGEDELVFDGASFAVDGAGARLAALPAFEEGLALVDLDASGGLEAPPPDDDGDVRRALVLGLADFARKNGLRRAVVGVSGGVDSALVAALAADALGPDRVLAVHIPSRHTAARSTDDARALCERLGVRLTVVPLEPLHAAAEATLPGLAGTAAENAQARLRCLVLMACVNRHGGLLLNTSNKTELSLGYGTLYGDLAGGLAPIADLTKPEVWRLAARDPRIPAEVVARVPTAELAPDQVDPFDYPRVSPLVEALVTGADPRAAVPDATDEELAALRERLARAEFKRRQAPPGLKVSPRAFGTGRLVPITHRWRGGDGSTLGPGQGHDEAPLRVGGLGGPGGPQPADEGVQVGRPAARVA